MSIRHITSDGSYDYQAKKWRTLCNWLVSSDHVWWYRRDHVLPMFQALRDPKYSICPECSKRFEDSFNILDILDQTEL